MLPFNCHKCGKSLWDIISRASPVEWWYHPLCRPWDQRAIAREQAKAAFFEEQKRKKEGEL